MLRLKRTALVRLFVVVATVALLLGGRAGSSVLAQERISVDSGNEQPTVEPTATPAVEPSVAAEESPEAPLGAISASAAEDGEAPEVGVRPRPESRPIVLATATPAGDAEPTQPAGPPRLDEPVLRWLPEILAASEASGTPAHIIAGVMRLESGGNPSVISPVGARGLMQIMPYNLTAMGYPEHLWHDPASNIMAGGYFLASRLNAYGSWEQAVGAYFGFGCDVFGTCTEIYIQVAFSWAYYYLPAIEDPLNSGWPLLPWDWVAPPIVPFVEQAPVPVQTPPSTRPTPGATASAGTTPVPGETPVPAPTDAPPGATEPPPAPTDVPTALPPPPTEVPTEPPPPVEQPTEPPVEPPPVEAPPSA